MSRRYANRDLVLLWARAAGRCSFPGCRQLLVEPETDHDLAQVIGEIAHIAAHSNKGPRADSTLRPADRDKYENLILLCPTHHTVVDKQYNTNTDAALRQWKQEHEEWVRKQWREEMPNVGFAELAVVTEALLHAPGPASTDFLPLDLAEKMARNRLTSRTHLELSMGLSKAREVERFIAHFAIADPDFPERLKAGFLEQYRRKQTEGLEGDALFEALFRFASQGRREFSYQAAGLAVLTHLFEACEVFER
jgi:hypothetical protein